MLAPVNATARRALRNIRAGVLIGWSRDASTQTFPGKCSTCGCGRPCRSLFTVYMASSYRLSRNACLPAALVSHQML